MPAFIDLSGQRFGYLIISDRAKNDKWDQVCWNYICDCGNKGVASSNRLTCKRSPMMHCGCLSSKHKSDAQKDITNITHGLSRTPEYKAIYQARRRIIKQNNNPAFNISHAEPFAMPRPKLDYCVYCKSTDNLTTDHIIPINKGGNQNPKNLIRACKSCNSAKHASFFIDWYIKSKRCTRSLTEIIIDMGFDSIFHLQNYQDSMCPEYVEENIATTVTKLLRAEKKSIRLLDRYYRSLDHYPTH